MLSFSYCPHLICRYYAFHPNIADFYFILRILYYHSHPFSATRIITQHEKAPIFRSFSSAAGRTRTGTAVNRLILSQVRLPIPPQRLKPMTEIYFSIKERDVQVIFYYCLFIFGQPCIIDVDKIRQPFGRKQL